MQLEWIKKSGREPSLRNASGSIGNTRSLAFVIRIPGDSPWVYMRFLLWICLLNAASNRSQAKLARLPYE
jgi:hypothetical protein